MVRVGYMGCVEGGMVLCYEWNGEIALRVGWCFVESGMEELRAEWDGGVVF